MLRVLAACLIIPLLLQQLLQQSSDSHANSGRRYNTDLHCDFGSLMKCFQHARFHHFPSEARQG